MAAEVGFPGLEVTDVSYGFPCFLWLPRGVLPASKLRMFPMVSHVSYGCRGGFCRPRSYGCFLWFPMFPMAAQVGFSGLEVTDVSYGFPCFLWLPRWVFPASKLRMFPMVSHVLFGLRMAARVGFCRPPSYGCFLWFPMFPMAAEVGFPGLQVTDVSYGFPCVVWAADGCRGGFCRPRSYGCFL